MRLVGLIAVERHLWLMLTDIKDKENAFLLDAPVSQMDQFGNEVNSIIERYCMTKQQSAAFRQLIPLRT